MHAERDSAGGTRAGSGHRLVTLAKRREFLRVRGGARAVTAAFVVEAKAREGDPESPARFGFTVTKKIGAAVVRNRVRRRLRALVCLMHARESRPGHDYVLIARAPAYDRPFAELAKDLEQALRRVHDRPARPRTAPSPSRKTDEKP